MTEKWLPRREMAVMKKIKFRPSLHITRSNIYQSAKEISANFLKNQFDAYVVGGSVRDFILFPRLIPKDIDIVTNARVEDVEKLFPNSSLVGKSFGVCIVKHKNLSFEVATYRKEGPYLDRRHPSSVSAGTFEEDSKRRDFTINTLYFSMLDNEILDLHGGLNDIKKKILRCVGKANDRIEEDSLRILRCLRFSANFNFKIEKSLLNAIKKYSDGLKHLPQERILDELSKVCALPEFVNKFYRYLDISLFFNSLAKKNQKYIRLSPLTMNVLKKFHFSTKSMFFDFFILLFKYYNINDWDKLKAELKTIPCSNYDTKLCLWFLNLIQLGSIQSDSENALFVFFKNLISIERIEKLPNPKIFLILKKLIFNISFGKLITNYIKVKDTFSPSGIIAELKQGQIPENEFSLIILKRFFKLCE